MQHGIYAPATLRFAFPHSLGRVVPDASLPEALPSFSDPVENGRIVGVVKGVEQLLLSLARVGIDLSNPQFAQAINDCVAKFQSG